MVFHFSSEYLIATKCRNTWFNATSPSCYKSQTDHRCWPSTLQIQWWKHLVNSLHKIYVSVLCFYLKYSEILQFFLILMWLEKNYNLYNRCVFLTKIHTNKIIAYLNRGIIGSHTRSQIVFKINKYVKTTNNINGTWI